MPTRDDTKIGEPSRTPAAMIAHCAKQAPDATALVMGSEQVSFGELEMRASQLAHCLRARGAGSEVVVGICRHRPDLTAERFLSDPFQAEGRMYRTGDLGCRLTHSSIAFLGREDDQVKIRGFRFELGEINTALDQQASVQSSVVVAREDTARRHGEKKLVAYRRRRPASRRSRKRSKNACDAQTHRFHSRFHYRAFLPL